MSHARIALIMAGGTGGHIFPALAVAQALREQGWQVFWLGGGSQSMEARLVPAQGFVLESIDFQGVRGKGVMRWLSLPWNLLRAWVQSMGVMRRVRANVVVGFGGYISFPGALAARCLGKPLLVHEQNSVPGLVNKVLSRMGAQVYTAFPDVLPKGVWVGNPLRAAFTQQAAPEQRFEQRTGSLRLVVVGGSLGAQVLNEVVPQALALLEPAQRPQVLHQSGEKHLHSLQARYAQAQVSAELCAFIDDTAQAFSQADVVLCRAGASTVTELAAVGAAAILVPFAAAVDDHQTTNARFLSDVGAAWMIPQSELTPERLSKILKELTREQLLQRAVQARKMKKIDATSHMVRACEELIA